MIDSFVGADGLTSGVQIDTRASLGGVEIGLGLRSLDSLAGPTTAAATAAAAITTTATAAAAATGAEATAAGDFPLCPCPCTNVFKGTWPHR